LICRNSSSFPLILWSFSLTFAFLFLHRSKATLRVVPRCRAWRKAVFSGRPAFLCPCFLECNRVESTRLQAALARFLSFVAPSPLGFPTLLGFPPCFFLKVVALRSLFRLSPFFFAFVLSEPFVADFIFSVGRVGRLFLEPQASSLSQVFGFLIANELSSPFVFSNRRRLFLISS